MLKSLAGEHMLNSLAGEHMLNILAVEHILNSLAGEQMGDRFLSTEGESNPLRRNSCPLVLLFLLTSSIHDMCIDYRCNNLVLLFLLTSSIHDAYLSSHIDCLTITHNELSSHSKAG